MRKFLFLILSAPLFLMSQTSEQTKKQGYIKKKDEKTNKLIYEGMFKDDRPVGKFKYYYPNDSIRAIVDFHPNGKSAYARLFHTNGKRMSEGKYLEKEIKDSVWTFYDESGLLLSREKYNKGKKDGKSIVYLPDGYPAEEKSYTMDVQDGPFKEYFSGHSVKASGTYVNGQLEGRAIYYYPNGVEVASGYYKKGMKNGPWIYRNEDGKIKEKELYKEGKPASKKETDEFFAKNKVEESKGGSTPVKAKDSAKKNKK
jgi:antitoxin component YwqK of YwqJK toxin-antitoxin module